MLIGQINSCCCFSLKTGTLIIAIFWMLNYVFFYGILIFNRDICEALSSLCFGRNDLETIWRLTYNSLGSVFILLLTYGTLKEDHKLMLPFLLFELIRLIIEILAFVFWIVKLLIHDFSNGCFFLIIGIIMINILAYLWVILYNRKEEIKSVKPPSYNKSVRPYAVNV